MFETILAVIIGNLIFGSIIAIMKIVSEERK